MHIETEIKCLLVQKDFRILYSYLNKNCPRESVTRQINYYFDFKDLSRSSKDLNIRMRLINEQAELTLKVPIGRAIKENVISSYEYNVNIDMQDALNYIKTGLSDSDIRKSFGDIPGVSDISLHDIICYGCLRTTRVAFIVKEDLPPLLMDISRYLGVSDYEIEWELTEVDRAQDILNNIFSNLGIKTHGGTRPKRHRFFNRLKEIQTEKMTL